MNTFKNIEELKRSFGTGGFDFPDQFFLGDDGSNQHVEFRQSTVVDHGLKEMMEHNYKPMWVYSLRPSPDNVQAAKAMGLDSWVVFLWGMDQKHHILPYDVRNIKSSRGTMTHMRSDDPRTQMEDYKEVNQERVIPDKVRVMLLDMPVARELIGKVDTGADVCSLHAEDINVQRSVGKVSFRCPPLSDNVITVPLEDQQAIQTPSSDGTEYRPVISLNLKVADKSLNDVRVNLNDRSNMEHPFLVGQNALEAGNFLIDPNIMKEDTDDETAYIQYLVEKFSKEEVEVAVDEKIITEEQITQMYDLFEGSDLTFGDLVKVLRTEAMDRMKDLDY